MANTTNTSSCTKVETSSLYHTWTIENYSYCSEKSERIQSSTFGPIDKNIEWCITLYPRGDCTVNRDYVSVYIHLITFNESVEIHSKCKVTFVNKTAERNKSFVAEHTFNQRRGFGFRQIIQRDELLDRDNGFIEDDKITILCEFILFGDIVNSSDSERTVTVPTSTIVQDFSSLFEDKILTDVIILVDGQEIQAHRAVLASRSAVFGAMFMHSTKEKEENIIDVKDIEFDVMYEVVKFLYTDQAEVKNISDRLLLAADKYDLKRLKALCEVDLLKTMSIENAANLFLLADVSNAVQMKDRVLSYLLMHLNKVTETEGWKYLLRRPGLLDDIIKGFSGVKIS